MAYLETPLPAPPRFASAPLALVASLGALLLVGPGCKSKSKSAAKSSPATAAIDPNAPIQVSGTTLKKRPIDITKDYAQRPVLLNVWASWCAPCKEEMPTLVRIHERQREVGAGLAVVGINVDSAGKRIEAKHITHRFAATFPHLHDPDSAVADRLGASSLPTTILLDRNHRVAWRQQGPFDAGDEAFQKALHNVLNQKVPAPAAKKTR